MKKLNLLLLSMVCLSACLFVGCAEKQAEIDGPVQMKSMELGLEISKADLENNKSGALIGDATNLGDVTIPYCDGTIENGMIAVATLSIDFLKADGSTNRTIASEVWKWEVSDLVSEYGKMSTLQQLNFTEDEVKAKITIDDFRVYVGGIDDETYPLDNLVFITPMEGSPYEGYVSTPVSKVFEVDLYEKQYMKMQVLCFNPEDIPYFGFAWSDFEVVTADEICMFFNCLGTAAQSRHQVLAAEVKAYFYSPDTDPEETEDDWAEYWIGQNYRYLSEGPDPEVDLEIEPFCIPCPGNWKGEHVDPDGDGNGDGGFKIEVTPKDGFEVITIYITEDQIQAFLDTNVEFDPWSVDELYSAKIASANDGTEDVPFIHYEMKNCYKSYSYYANLYYSEGEKYSDIYAMTWDGTPETDFTMSKIFTTTDWNHIAMTPDESKLILVSESGEGWGGDISVYDIYSLKTVDLDFVAPDPDLRGRPAQNYRFTELVYSGDQLYGGCMSLNCLVPININLDNNTFTYGVDIINAALVGEPEGGDISGGDLLVGGLGDQTLLYSFTKADNGSIIQYFPLNGMSTPEDPQLAANLSNLTGVCMLKDNQSALISTCSGVTWGSATTTVPGDIEFRFFTTTGTPVTIATELEGVGGDMASAWNPVQKSVLEALFDVTFVLP